MERRLLQAKEISCRIQTINEYGLSLLLYVTSRAGQNLLDETYGPLGWKRHHKTIDGNLYCEIEVWDAGKNQWVGKEDVGTESYAEKEKGQASDSFKRACVNFGIGRELYSAPYIWLTKEQCRIKSKEDGKGNKRYYCNDKFSVKYITYNTHNEIDALEIINQDKETVYRKWPTQKIDASKIKVLEQYLEESKTDITEIYNMCSISELSDMDREDFKPVCNKMLKKIEDMKRGVKDVRDG